MRKLILTEQAARLVRSLALTRVAENSRLLTRVDNSAPEPWLKEVRREIDSCIAIAAQLGESGESMEVEPKGSAVLTAVSEIPESEDEVPRELREMGVTLEQHQRALNPMCVHGALASEPCARCAAPDPVPPV